MKTGLMWFDNDPKKSLGDKILDAAGHYLRKYRVNPNCCYVHPSMIQNSDLQVDRVVIRTSKSVLPNHLWMVRTDETTRKPAAGKSD
jgi:hypothetical protein